MSRAACSSPTSPSTTSASCAISSRALAHARRQTAAIPKAHIYRAPAGILKAVIDAKTDIILGAHFFCPASEEMINLMKTAIDNGITAGTLAGAIYTHPTMTEALNDLFA